MLILTKRLFLFLALIASVFLCHANDDDSSYWDDEEEEERVQISPQKRKRIQKLQKEIRKLEAEFRVIKKYIPGNIRTINRLICYIHCVKMAPVTCRVQMGPFRVKTIPGGTYYVYCPRKCNYPNYPDNLEDAKRKHRGCVHYDKNGYWFVTYVCNAHKFHWHFDLVRRYQGIYRQYPGFENYTGQYREYSRVLRAKRAELKKLLPPKPKKKYNDDDDDDDDGRRRRNDDDDDDDDDDRRRRNDDDDDDDDDRRRRNDDDDYDSRDRRPRKRGKISKVYDGNSGSKKNRNKKFITLHFGLSNSVTFALRDGNQFHVEKGKREVGIHKSLSTKFPSLYFKQPTCLVYSSTNEKLVWNLNDAIQLNFEAEKISDVEVIKSSRSGVKFFNLDDKKTSQNYYKTSNRIQLIGSTVSVIDTSAGVAEYKIRIYFE